LCRGATEIGDRELRRESLGCIRNLAFIAVGPVQSRRLNPVSKTKFRAAEQIKIAATAFRDECYSGSAVERHNSSRAAWADTEADHGGSKCTIVGRIMTKRECGFNWEMAPGVWSGDSWVNRTGLAKSRERRVSSRSAEEKGRLIAGEVIDRHWILEE
jgi:hypothetical protein